MIKAQYYDSDEDSKSYIKIEEMKDKIAIGLSIDDEHFDEIYLSKKDAIELSKVMRMLGKKIDYRNI